VIGMRGRKPKPTQIKILEGSFVKNPQRQNTREPDAPDRLPRCPSHLNDVGKKKWRETLALLKEMGIASAAYADLLELYADTYSSWRDAREKVLKLGIATITKVDGSFVIQRNPFETAMHKYRDALMKIEAELGLTPSAKSRLHRPEKQGSGVSARKRKA